MIPDMALPITSSSLDGLVPFGSTRWWGFAALILFARSMDLLSTWIATPNLVLEGNPIARKLGWKFGIPLNLGLALTFAWWPMLAISLSTTSVLVAARNFQHAWLMRAMGEANYRAWFSYCVDQSQKRFVLACYWAEALLAGGVGACLMYFAGWQLIPFAIGLGIGGYATAIAFFISLAIWRLH